jgi:hypothetical protein
VRRCPRVIVAVAAVFAVAQVLAILGAVEVYECSWPSWEAGRVLVRVVAITEGRDFRATGRVGDIDAELRSEVPHLIGLDRYRIVVHKEVSGYEVAVEPSGWCFCRESFILHDGGKRIEVVPSWLSRTLGR